jgi:hypothetical protein
MPFNLNNIQQIQTIQTNNIKSITNKHKNELTYSITNSTNINNLNLTHKRKSTVNSTINSLNQHLNAIDTHIINNIANVSGIPLVSKYVPCLFSDEILEEPRDLSKEENSIFELFEYYQSGYGPSREGVPCSTEFISAFKTKIFSGQLRNITEFAIDEELQPDSDSIWKCFQNTFVVPEVHVNGKRTYSLIDTGASCSAMSIKFYQTEAVKSLKLVFRKSSRIVRMADNKEVNSEGILENVPVTINNHQTNANTILMNDLSYDLILGRDWWNANVVIIDFNKRKIYLLKPTEKSEPFVLINHLEDNKSDKIEKQSLLRE